MSIVSILVFVSQAARRLAIKAKNKAITAVSNRIKKVEAEQVNVEARRSDNMIKAHNSFYAEKDASHDEYDKAVAAARLKMNVRQRKAAELLAETQRTIALTSQAASNQLKGELVALRSELDHLTK